MRIIAGQFKGRKLPELKANGVRPTLDRVRENLFNIISTKVRDCSFLDLFSGSGAIGVEALSRGAKNVVFCDKSKDVCKHLMKIGELLSIKLNVINADYKLSLKSFTAPFDIIYLDPPYEMDGSIVLNELQESKACSDKTLIIYERLREKEFSLPTGYILVDERKYGITTLTFLRKNYG